MGALQSKERYKKKPLVEEDRILFPQLHIKLDLINQLTKARTRMVAASFTCVTLFLD